MSDAAIDLLREAHEHVCSMLCPSVKYTSDPWPHVDLCGRIAAALTSADAPDVGRDGAPRPASDPLKAKLSDDSVAALLAVAEALRHALSVIVQDAEGCPVSGRTCTCEDTEHECPVIKAFAALAAFDATRISSGATPSGDEASQR